MIVIQLGLAAVSVALGLITQLDMMTPYILLALTFCGGIGAALSAPAWQSIVPELVPRPMLRPAVALNSLGTNIARAIGPALGGLIIATAGTAMAYYVDVASYALIVGALLWWRRSAAAIDRPERLVGAKRAGVRFAWHQPNLQRVLLRALLFFIGASCYGATQPEASMEIEVQARKGGKEHLVTITVNEKPVEIQGPQATGLEIKRTAIARGVKSKRSFVHRQVETVQVALGLLLGLCAVIAGPAHAQSGEGELRPPPLTTLRYDEDYAYLRNPAARTGAWWEPLKYVPLNAAGNVYVTLGAELRLRYEGFENNNWGQEPVPDDGYLWYRALPLADLHLGPHVRLFGQLIAAWAEGKEPSASPIDETGVDLLQGFADVRLPLGDADASLTLRPGRQMLSYGSEKLIGIRYGPNVLRAFDGVKGFLQAGAWRVDGFYARPVAPGLDDFDDETDDTQSVWSLYATRRLPIGQGTGLDLYYIGYDNDVAAFNQGMGSEQRHTVGVRFFGQAQGWDWDWEAIYQFGAFADGNIAAWSVASSTGYTFATFPLTPRLGLKANIVSGDNDPDDRDLQTVNPLFPKGQYFGELALLGPANLINLHATVDLHLGGGWSVNGAAVLYWRESTGDGIYDFGGNLLRGDGGSDARCIGTQAEVVLTYEHHRNLDAMLAYAQFQPGAYIKDTGPSETVHFVAAELRFRF